VPLLVFLICDLTLISCYNGDKDDDKTDGTRRVEAGSM
jgi:hypothetical protein